MSIFDSIILGLIQGLTEFIPVSSSGHLVLAREFFKIGDNNGLAYDAVLQLATAFAVLVYFRNELWALFKTGYAWVKGNGEVDLENKALLTALVLGTIPAMLAGIILEKFLDGAIRDSLVVASALIAGSIVFWIAEQVAEKNRHLTGRRGFLIGIFQVFALIPGVSRSGITISGGLFMGLNRELATRFSFLLSFPIIMGSGLKKFIDLGFSGLLNDIGISLLTGSVTAFVFGILSIHFLIKYLKNHTLTLFVVYRIVLAVVILFVVL
jgi:undecaprenyl-diphosphatase